MKLEIIRLGKIKEPYIQMAEQHYLKMLPQLKIRTLKGSDSVLQDTQELIEKLKDTPNVFLLAENGKKYDSLQFAALLKPYLLGIQEATLVIAGPFGWAYDQIPTTWRLLSLSALTFPHELAYILLLEQIFRAGKITKDQKYHY